MKRPTTGIRLQAIAYFQSYLEVVGFHVELSHTRYEDLGQIFDLPTTFTSIREPVLRRFIFQSVDDELSPHPASSFPRMKRTLSLAKPVARDGDAPDSNSTGCRVLG